MSAAAARRAGLGVFLLALAVRVRLVLAFPAVHGGDSVARLARSDELLLAYQLPLPQALVFLARAALGDPFWTRLAFCIVGAAVPVTVERACGRLLPPLAARAAAVLCALHPLLVYYSVVPYQESLMLLGVLGAAASRRTAVRSGLLAIACLSRYEAWAAVPIFVAPERPRLLSAILRYAWAPLAWTIVWGGLGPAGSYVLDLDPAAARLPRLRFLWLKLVEYTGWPLVVLALLGAGIALFRRQTRPAAALAGAGLLLLMAAMVAGAHEFPPGTGLVSERLLHVPVVAACIAAGTALVFLPRRGWRGFAGAALVAAALAGLGLGWLRQTDRQVAEANRDPGLRLGHRVAFFLAPRLGPHDAVAVLGPPVSSEALDHYVRKVAAGGGHARRASELAAGLAGHSADRDLVAAHLPIPPSRVSGRPLAPGRFVVAYDDAPESRAWRGRFPLAAFQAGGRRVAVYEQAAPP
jgi:hypothetical protein